MLFLCCWYWEWYYLVCWRCWCLLFGWWLGKWLIMFLVCVFLGKWSCGNYWRNCCCWDYCGCCCDCFYWGRRGYCCRLCCGRCLIWDCWGIGSCWFGFWRWWVGWRFLVFVLWLDWLNFLLYIEWWCGRERGWVELSCWGIKIGDKIGVWVVFGEWVDIFGSLFGFLFIFM